jgi:hypothetical protein
MIGLLLLGITVYSEEPTVLADLPEGATLVYRYMDYGVSYRVGNRLVLLSDQGKIEKTIDFSNMEKPLFYWKGKGIVTSSSEILKIVPDDPGGAANYTGPRAHYFANGPMLFYADYDVMFLGGSSNHIFPRYDRYAAVAVDRDATRLAYMHMWSATPTLRLAHKVENTWYDEPEVSPMVKGVGHCSVIPIRKDMVFISQNLVAFVGEIVEPMNEQAYDRMLTVTNDFRKWPLERVSANVRDCFLFVMQVNDGLAIPYGRFQYEHDPELRSTGTGYLVTSDDGKSLYMAVQGKILKFDSTALVEVFEARTDPTVH